MIRPIGSGHRHGAMRGLCAPSSVGESDDGYRRPITTVEHVLGGGRGLDDPLPGLARRAQEHVGRVLMLALRHGLGGVRRGVTRA